MSLIINADGEYLTGTGGSFAGAGLTQATMAICVKRDSGTSTYQSYCAIGRDIADSYDSIGLAHNAGSVDCFIFPAGASTRVDPSVNSNSTAWQWLILTFEKDVANKVYTALIGGSVNSGTGVTSTAAFNSALDEIRIGLGNLTQAGWNCRARLAHCAFWNTRLTSGEITDLVSGGTGGISKNPQAIQNANLTFYAPLTSDATVTVGGVSLSATGTLTYDGADNPNVEAYGGGSTSYTLTVDSGTYSLSGASLATPISVVMAAGDGTYSVTGQDITFGGSSVYTLSLEAGAYNITSETPVIGISMGLDAGSYSIVGQDITLSSTSGSGTMYSLSIEAGTYTTTGQDLSLIVAYLASLDAGTYDVNGKNVRLVSSTEPVLISSGNHTISVSIKIGI